jgi:hypothetical protein
LIRLATNRSRLSVWQSPLGLTNVFCGVTAGTWLSLLALTFTDRSFLILAMTAVWLLIVGMTVLFMVYLSRRRVSWKVVSAVAAAWMVGTLLASHFEVAHWQAQQRLWSGFVFDSRYGWYPEANLHQRELLIPNGTYIASTDELGHRNPLPYPEDHLLPAILQGDSNAFGFGLAEDETLSAVLNALRPDLPIYNVGVLGFDLNHYYYQYAELSKQFQIKRRIVLWNIGNDFTLSALETPNFFRRPYLYVDHSEVRFASDFRSPFPVQGYGQSFIPPYRSYDGLIRTVADDWADLYPAFLVRWPLSRQLIRTYHPKLCRFGELLPGKPKQLELFAPDWMMLKRELWPAPYTQYAEDLPLLLRELKQQNSQLTICVFPFREQVIPEEFRAKERLLTAAGYAASDIEPLSFNRYFKAICDAEAITLVDPTQRFLQQNDRAALYQRNDQHLSAQGMRICAEELVGASKISPVPMGEGPGVRGVQ